MTKVKVTDFARLYRWANHAELTPPITAEEFARWHALGWIRPASGWELTPQGRWQSLSPEIVGDYSSTPTPEPTDD